MGTHIVLMFFFLPKQRRTLRLAATFGIGLLAAGLFCVSGHPAFAAAQTALEQFGEVSILPQTSLPIVIARLIRAVLGVLGIITVLLVMYAGWLYMTSGGDAHRMEKAKKLLKNGGIGLLIILSSFTITQFILNALLGGGTSGPRIRSVAERYGEPLAGALNGRMITDHYPERNAVDMPRNVQIFVTFAEPVRPSTIIKGYDDAKTYAEADPPPTALDERSVLIFRTLEEEDDALVPNAVNVFVTEDWKTFVFDPVGLLGNDKTDTNYTVKLTSRISKKIGGSSLLGPKGYPWTFEVSTVSDLTPPQVVSVAPAPDQAHDRNMTIEMTFSEAMSPAAATGSWKNGSGFTNITVTSAKGAASPAGVNGAFEISNAYRTVTFTTDDACAQDPCGNTIYCLPGDASILATAKAAAIDPNNKPQAKLVGGRFNGLVDAAGNSLDGNGENGAEGPDADNFSWPFLTRDAIDMVPPSIASISPKMLASLREVSPTAPALVTFSRQMKTSTLTNSSLQLWPDPFYDFWFVVRSEIVDGKTQSAIQHPMLVQTEDGGWNYYPVVTHQARGDNQVCLYPSVGPESGTNQGACKVSADPKKPYCCDGSPQEGPCRAPRASEKLKKDVLLPDTSE